MGRGAPASTSGQLVSTVETLVRAVECPHCGEPVDVPVPDREVEPTASPYVAAFGDHTVVHCGAGHRFWVYYC